MNQRYLPFRDIAQALTAFAAWIFFSLHCPIVESAERPKLKAGDVISGRVVDSESKLPVARAYAVLIYGAPSKDPNILFSHCVKTRGAFVNADGSYSFNADWVDGLVPDFVTIVAPDYFSGGSTGRGETTDLVKRTPEETFRGDFKKSFAHDYQYQLLSASSLDCWRAKSRDDAAAAIPALRILRESFLKYYLGNSGGIGLGHAKEIDRIIYLLQQLPSK